MEVVEAYLVDGLTVSQYIAIVKSDIA